jgi:hypothetical protein
MIFPGDKLLQRSSGSLPGMVQEPLRRDGFVVLRHVLSPSLLERVKSDLFLYLKDLVSDEEDSPQRIGGILSMSPPCQVLAANPVVLAVIARYLGTLPPEVSIRADFFLWAPAGYAAQGVLKSKTRGGTIARPAPSVWAIWPVKNFLSDRVIFMPDLEKIPQQPGSIRKKPGQGDVLLVSEDSQRPDGLGWQTWLRSGLVFEYTHAQGRTAVPSKIERGALLEGSNPEF